MGGGKKRLKPCRTLCNCIRTWQFSIQSATNCTDYDAGTEREGGSTHKSTPAYSEGGSKVSIFLRT